MNRMNKENVLLCGAGKAKITPPRELFDHLFGLMKSSFGDIYDELYARVILLQNAHKKLLIASVDLDKAPCPVEFTQKLQEVTGVPKEDMLFFGIHTHAAPITGYRPFEARNDITKKPPQVQEAVHKYEQIVLEGLIQAARDAMSGLRPAKYGFAYGTSYINVNRTRLYKERRPDGSQAFYTGQGWNVKDADPTAFLMRFEDLKGKPIAFLMNYAMHNVAMFLNDCGDGRMAVSSDVGGNVSKHMEAWFPGAVALWSSGAAGDMNCIFNPALMEFPDPETGAYKARNLRDLKTVSAFMEYMAAIHFHDMLEINEKICVLEDRPQLQTATEYSKTPACTNAMTSQDYDRIPGKTYNIRLRLFHIGQVALIGVDGELYSRLGKVIREASPMKNTVIITHESSLLLDNPGYIYDDETIAMVQKSYGCGLPGWQNFYGVPYTVAPSLKKCTKHLFEIQQ